MLVYILPGQLDGEARHLTGYLTEQECCMYTCTYNTFTREVSINKLDMYLVVYAKCDSERFETCKQRARHSLHLFPAFSGLLVLFATID